MRKKGSYKAAIGRITGYTCLMIFMFPLGLWSLLRRLRYECGKGGRAARIVLTAGCILCSLSLLSFVLTLYTGIDPMGHFADNTMLFFTVGVPGCCFLSAGLFYLQRERIIRRYRAVLCDRPARDADEVCAALKKDRLQVFTDISLLTAERLLKDIFVSYDRQKIMLKDSEEASVRYCSTCGRAVILDTSRITVCPDCGGIPVMRTPAEQKVYHPDQTGSVIRKVLWITGAVLSALVGYYIWPFCLMLIAAACILELRQAYPDYNLIRKCGTGIMIYDLTGLFYPGIYFIRDHIPEAGAVQFLNYLLFCFLFVPVFYILSAAFRQRSGHIQIYCEAERDLHPETLEDICGYTGLHIREAAAIRKILYPAKKDKDRGAS